MIIYLDLAQHSCNNLQAIHIHVYIIQNARITLFVKQQHYVTNEN